MLTRSVTAAVIIASCTPTAFAGDPAGGFSQWQWTNVNSDAPWARRAGLKVFNIDGDFYLMGGRTANPPQDPPIFGDSTIWSDVWKSSDQGQTWEQLLESQAPGHWSPRAYYGAASIGDEMYVFGGQDFLVIPNPDCPPPYEGCSPFIPVSNFFNDVWSSVDGVNWDLRTAEAGWSGRAGISAVTFNDEIYLVGGSYLDDTVFGSPERIYYNDVWKTADGETWTQMTAEAPFDARAGAALAAKDGYLYMFGGEQGFLCEPFPGCELPYYNDVWRTSNGTDWELLVEDAPWPKRPGHVVVVVDGWFVLFGGFGIGGDPFNPFAPSNPMDIWVSQDGIDWQLASESPWNALEPADIKYDFAAITADVELEGKTSTAIFTFGGDRESFDFTDFDNWLNLDNDVWRFAVPVPCAGDFDGNNRTNVDDLLTVIAGWNNPYDVDDLMMVINAWGCEF